MAVVTRAQPNRVLANCESTDGVGQCVYVRAAVVGGKLQVGLADPSDYDKMPAIGMIIHKATPSATECIVQLRGQVAGVYAGLTPGEMLFLDDSGGLSDEPPEPTAPKPFKFVQNLGTALSTDIIGLDPDLTLTRRRL